MSLSKDAVKILVEGGDPSGKHDGPLIVKLLNIRPLNKSSDCSLTTADRFRQCQICDKEYIVDGMVCLAPSHMDMRSCTIHVEGYVTSEANYNKRSGPTEVFVCITSFTILSNITDEDTQCSRSRLPTASKIVGGKTGTFFQDVAPWLSDEELSGINTSGVFGIETNKEAIISIASFLASHQAMNTISQSSTVGGEMKVSNYVKALKDFEDSQLKRQMATSLISNTDREDASRSEIIIERYSKALQMALEHAKLPQRKRLTIEVICAWHKEIGGDGLVDGAGCIRKKQVRAGPTSFTRVDHVENELKKFLDSLRDLEFRLLRSGGTMPAGTNVEASMKQGYGPITFASAALFGINDIHPFNDGNGRLSRILGNWALARAGLPFVVNFFATPQQRSFYVRNLQITRRNIMLVAHGQGAPDILSTIRRLVGPLKPLVDLILDKVHKATIECEKVIAGYSAKEAEDLDTQAAKRFRERVAQEPCIICYDLQANIATLCCGKPLHLNCIAQWLSTSDTCPQCRCHFPQLPPRIPAPEPATMINVFEDVPNAAIDTTGSTTGSVEYSYRSDYAGSETHQENDTTSTATSINSVQEDTTTAVDDTIEDTTEVASENNSTTEVASEEDTTEIAIEEDNTTAVDEDNTTTVDEYTTTISSVDENATCDTSSTTDETSDVEGTSLRRCPQICTFNSCRNKAAVDCVNDACGRCCLMYGNHSCPRHSV